MTTTTTMQIAGVRFRDAGRIFYFNAGDIGPHPGEYVVAESDRGLEMGKVVIAPGQMLGGDLEDRPPILRLATGEDREAHAYWREKAHEALELARLRAGETGVHMMVVSAEYNLDGKTLTLYYESEEHVDYRPVVRALSQELNVTVQMERVGPRDRAKLTDGYDRCGQRLCCSTWLTSFPSVSIKMAKEQNLALNPAKISGVCGRLYCCLTYEYEAYRELRGQLPKLNQRVSTPTGDAKVIAVNTLKETVTLMFEDRTRIEVTKDEVQYGKLVRPAEVEIGEPTYDIETRDAKTALLPVAPVAPGGPRRPMAPQPPRRDRPRPPQAERPARPAEQPTEQARPEQPADGGPARRRRRRRRRGPGGEGPPAQA